jgi:hypothetical protein
MSKYKMIQLTNNNILEVAANALVPLGNITRKIDCYNNCSTFTVATSNADSVILSEPGYYKITYSGSFVCTDAGTAKLNLIVNGSTTFSASATNVAAETVNLTIPYVVRVFPVCQSDANNNPMTVQIQTETALTSANTNLIIEKVY